MIILNQSLNGLMHSLLPARLRESLKPNTANYIRARALAIMLVVVTILSVLFLLVLSSIHLFNNPALLKYDLIPFSVLSLLVLQTWLFYRFNNYWISGLAFTNFYFLVIVVLLILNGGYKSHGMAILLTCPMISFVVGNRQEGIQNAGISIIFFWILILLYSIGFELPNIFYAHDSHVIFGMNWVFSVAVIAITLTVIEIELQNRDARPSVQPDLMRNSVNEYDASEFGKQMKARLHALLPAGIHHALNPNSMAYVRTQILTILLLVATFLCFFTVILIIGIDLALDLPQLQYDMMILWIVPCFALQTWFFYKFNNPLISSMVLGYFTFLVIVGAVLLSGGYDSPVIVLMLLCPICFFMISGMRDGVINSILIAIIGIILAYLNHNGFVFTDFFHDAAQHVTAGIAWFIAIIATMVCMMTYDNEMEKL